MMATVKTWNLGQRRIVLEDDVITYYCLPLYPKAGNYVARKWWVNRGKVWTQTYRDGWFGSGPDRAWKTQMNKKAFRAILERLKALKEADGYQALKVVTELFCLEVGEPA